VSLPAVNASVLVAADGEGKQLALLAPNGRDLIFSGYATSGPIGGEDLLLARYTGFRPLATAPGAAVGAGVVVVSQVLGGATEGLSKGIVRVNAQAAADVRPPCAGLESRRCRTATGALLAPKVAP